MSKSKKNPIDAAYLRYAVLMEMLTHFRKQAHPTQGESIWTRSGVVSPDDKKDEARKKIDLMLDELDTYLSHATNLDMAASFELACRARIGTRIGEVKKAYEEGSKKNKPPAYLKNLIADSDAYDSLGKITSLVSTIDVDLREKLKVACGARNVFAHGTNTSNRSSADPQETKEVLIAVYGLL